MPFYTFRCNACGERFEVRCTIAEKDSGSVVCPGCGANELDRIFQGFSVATKNSGGCANADNCPSGGCCGGTCARHQNH